MLYSHSSVTFHGDEGIRGDLDLVLGSSSRAIALSLIPHWAHLLY